MPNFIGRRASFKRFSHMTVSAAFEAGRNRDSDLDELPRLHVERAGFRHRVAELLIRRPDFRILSNEVSEPLGKFAHAC